MLLKQCGILYTGTNNVCQLHFNFLKSGISSGLDIKINIEKNARKDDISNLLVQEEFFKWYQETWLIWKKDKNSDKPRLNA